MTYCTSRNKQDYQSRVQFHFGFVPTTKYIFFPLFCVYIHTSKLCIHTRTYTQKHSCKNTHICSAVAGEVRNVSRCRYFVFTLPCVWDFFFVILIVNFFLARDTCLFSYVFFSSIIHLSCNKTFGRSYTRVSELTRIDRNVFYKGL